MSSPAGPRRLPWDWYEGVVPPNVILPDDAYAETSYSFLLMRSRAEPAVVYGAGAATYLGTMFDLGERATVRLGRLALVHGAWIIADESVVIGDACMISWNVVIMDTYRVPLSAEARRRLLERLADTAERRPCDGGPPRPVRLGDNVWLGFDVCVLPGVTIGEGSIIGARSVVAEDIPPYTIAAGNPARPIRTIPKPGANP